MKSFVPLLQIQLNFSDFKFGLLCFISAFLIAMVCMPPVIRLVNKFRLHDIPDERKEHSLPTPTLGGIAIVLGMMISLTLWFPYSFSREIMICFFSMTILCAVGITDDLNDLSAKYKFIVEIALALLIAVSGIRITTFGGLFGINELSLTSQFSFTVLVIVGIINAFNFIDGIDGLAAGMSFMSLITLGIFFTLSNEKSFAVIAFALAGSVLAFLYFNMNPAKIFMGDTGSLVVGFVIAILCTKFIQVNGTAPQPLIKVAPLFALGMVLIPVFDAIRVSTLRIWKGQSPFQPDRTHIHHLLTNAGISHSRTSKIICGIHGFILIEVYWLRELRPGFILCMLLATMIIVTIGCYNIHRLKWLKKTGNKSADFEFR
jgi:UDP-GlcNAc:undecaprenyl-phosphate GlcNAc-1-phosphate transferase